MASLLPDTFPAGFSYKDFTIGIIVVIEAFEQYLAVRQRRKLALKTLPKVLQGSVDEDTFAKSREYTLDKSRFHVYESLFGVAESVLMLHFNVYPFIWYSAESFLAERGLAGEIYVSILYYLVKSTWETLIGLPFSIYSTFVLEQKHGFNRTTVGTFITDMVKSYALMLVLMPPILAGLVWVLRWGGLQLVVYAWIFMFSLQMFFMTIYPTVIQPLFNKFAPLDEGSLRTKIETLAAGLKFPLRKLFVMDGSKRSGHSNAYMFGFWRNKRIVLYDTLIKQCSEEEIVAVLAHELGHWWHGHTLQNMFIGQAFTLLQFSGFAYVKGSAAIARSFGFHTSPEIIAFELFQLVIKPVGAAIQFGFHFLSRMFEYQADAFAAAQGYASELCSGLLRLQKENLSAMNNDWLYSTYYHSHPTLPERLAAIQRLDRKDK
mmetsp:Transcript_10212/g.37560  ORF Transcript_10212/g.37560 Transcript_10212/m.37560 type:complete len:432 (+) Transcript_10212:144-1439(+)|eukprot:scaffold605_cov400-Prasinococcus_capsulatus_cf.AAC.11